jgi:hypothetical protein
MNARHSNMRQDSSVSSQKPVDQSIAQLLPQLRRIVEQLEQSQPQQAQQSWWWYRLFHAIMDVVRKWCHRQPRGPPPLPNLPSQQDQRNRGTPNTRTPRASVEVHDPQKPRRSGFHPRKYGYAVDGAKPEYSRYLKRKWDEALQDEDQDEKLRINRFDDWKRRKSS